MEELFSQFLPAAVCAEIVSMPPPNPTIGPDQICWGLSSDGRFSSKSAYDSLETLEVHHHNPDWRKLWRWRGPYKVTHFLWRLANDGLWVNFKRWQARMSGNPRCPLCDIEEETALHLFRDCSEVKPLWLQICDPSCLPRFFQLSLKDWVNGFLDRSFFTPGSSTILDFGFCCGLFGKLRLMSSSMVDPSTFVS